uniref:C-C chemokine receptor type 10-like n=1 Tax=Podarcis muralis TaxID=64176 RepID=UPI00109EEF6D
TGTCQALQGLHALSFYSGFLSLMGLTVDRYVAIVWAPVAHRLHSSTTCWGQLCSGLVWLFSMSGLPISWVVDVTAAVSLAQVALGFALPFAVMAGLLHSDHLTKTKDSCLEDGGHHRGVSLVQVALGFVLPFTVIAACYTAITCALLASLCAQSLKALRLILALVLVFLALQLPYALLTSLDMTALMGHQALSCKVILRRDLASSSLV